MLFPYCRLSLPSRFSTMFSILIHVFTIDWTFDKMISMRNRVNAATDLADDDDGEGIGEDVRSL